MTRRLGWVVLILAIQGLMGCDPETIENLSLNDDSRALVESSGIPVSMAGTYYKEDLTHVLGNYRKRLEIKIRKHFEEKYNSESGKYEKKENGIVLSISYAHQEDHLPAENFDGSIWIDAQKQMSCAGVCIENNAIVFHQYKTTSGWTWESQRLAFRVSANNQIEETTTLFKDSSVQVLFEAKDFLKRI